MTVSLTLAAAGGVLVAAGVTLLLERSLTRLVVGVLTLGNGANLLILTAGGPAGNAPILRPEAPGTARPPFSDPLPQVLILTAIVIALGSAAFVLAIAYRGGRLNGDDEVRDDIEDRRLARERRGRRAGGRAERRRRALDDPGDPADPAEPENPAGPGDAGEGR